MKFGMLSGVNRQWHPNGQLALETEFNQGELTCEHVA